MEANFDQSNLHSKSDIVVEELGSKIGTVVDGVKVKGSTVLTGNEHVLRLGHYEHALRWALLCQFSRQWMC